MGRLQWTPDTFWNSTPMDLVILGEGIQRINAPETPRAMSRERFEELMQLYPDET